MVVAFLFFANNKEINIKPIETIVESDQNIKDGVVLLSTDEVNNINESMFEGQEYASWEGWKDIKKNGLLSGKIDIDYISDKVYMSMKLPSEATTYMKYRVNPSIISFNAKGYNKTCSLGAVYPVEGATLPDSININIGKMIIFVLKSGAESQWEVLDAQNPFTEVKHFQVATLPWSLGEYYRPTENIIYHDDYVEFNCSANELYGKVFHFYGEKTNCISDDVIGYVVIYEAWSDTPDIDGKLACTIGADQISGNKTAQVFSGKNYLLTNEHRLIIGHSLPDVVYEELIKEGRSPEICLQMFNDYN